MSHDCCVALPCDTTGLSAVCDSGISLSYSLTILGKTVDRSVAEEFTVGKMESCNTTVALRQRILIFFSYSLTGLCGSLA